MPVKRTPRSRAVFGHKPQGHAATDQRVEFAADLRGAVAIGRLQRSEAAGPFGFGFGKVRNRWFLQGGSLHTADYQPSGCRVNSHAAGLDRSGRRSFPVCG
jgi:hypothetical protein